MNFTNKKKELVREFAPMLEKSSLMEKIWMFFLVYIILIGIYAFIQQMTVGQEVTGMRDHVVWGFYGVNFLFLMGISYSGAFLSAILHFVNTPWKRAVIRIIEIITVLSLAIGPLFIFLCMGRIDRLHYLFMYPRIQSPITWDVIAITTDLIGCVIYLYLTFIPDLATLRDHDELKFPKWRKNLYRFLAAGYYDTVSQRTRLYKITRGMSAMIIIMAIAVYTVMAWIFSLTLQPGWNSTIFATYFIIAGIYSGIGVIILTMFIVRKTLKLNKYIKSAHFKAGGFILMVIAILFGYFTFSEYFAKWYSNKAYDISLLDALFTRYFWEFIFANYIGVIIPILVIIIPRLRTINMITFASVIAICGVWMNRYLIIVPSLENPYFPIQDTRLEYIYYSPTWIEYSLSLAGIAAILLLFTLIIKFVPIIPMHEVLDDDKQIMKSRSKVDKEIKFEQYA